MKGGARKHDSAVLLKTVAGGVLAAGDSRGLDSQLPTCESRFAKSLRALGFVGTRRFWGYSLRLRQDEEGDRRVLTAHRREREHVEELVVPKHLRVGIGPPEGVDRRAERVEESSHHHQHKPWNRHLEQLRERSHAHPAKRDADRGRQPL